MDLLARIQHWGTTTPERIAHVSAGQTLTYGGLAHESDLLAGYLIQHLPDNKAPIILRGHKENEMLIGMLGCIKAGHPYIPLDISLPDQRVDTIITASKTILTLTPELIQLIIPRAEHGIKTRAPAKDDGWYVIFTSGSTGEPKGVVITRESLESFVDWILPEQGFKEGGEVFLNQAPFSFDLSVMDLYSSLASGGILFSITKDEIAELKTLYQTFAKSEISVWVSTPSFARLCLMDSSFNESMLPRVRKFWFCGETLAPEVAAGLLKRFPKAEVWNTYGPTEATVATTSIQITEEVIAKYSPLPVGRAKPNSLVVVHDSDGRPVADGERGEVIIAGENVSTGYIHRPDLTSRAFFKLNNYRAYRSGDSGHYADGWLFFDGRMDFQIKLSGYRIEIGDIEANLHALENVQDAVVIAALKNERADHLVAFVILKQKSDDDFATMKKMKQALGERVPEYMLPRRFIFLDEFPITPNGKADRRKLAEKIQ